MTDAALCGNCEMPLRDHAQTKCLYMPTSFIFAPCHVCNAPTSLHDIVAKHAGSGKFIHGRCREKVFRRYSE